MTHEEIVAMIEEKGDLATAEAMALEQVDATLEALNVFAAISAAYRHPVVTMPYAVELMMIMLTETVKPQDQRRMLDGVIAQLNEALEMVQVNEPPKNSDQEPDPFADGEPDIFVEPANG